jgi:hypothetical protein
MGWPLNRSHDAIIRVYDDGGNVTETPNVANPYRFPTIRDFPILHALCAFTACSEPFAVRICSVQVVC